VEKSGVKEECAFVLGSLRNIYLIEIEKIMKYCEICLINTSKTILITFTSSFFSLHIYFTTRNHCYKWNGETGTRLEIMVKVRMAFKKAKQSTKKSHQNKTHGWQYFLASGGRLSWFFATTSVPVLAILAVPGTIMKTVVKWKWFVIPPNK